MMYAGVMRKGFSGILIITGVLLVIAAAGVAGFFVKSNLAKKVQPSPSPVLENSSSPSPETNIPAIKPTPLPLVSPGPGPEIPKGWQTYKNVKYGFQISYPPTWKALDDKENLYGWPNGVVLLYKGGQSYDIPVEVWDSEAQYKAKYPNQSVIVYKIGNKFITMLDVNKEPDAPTIIASFKTL